MGELAKIRIIEDDATIRALLEMALLGAGYSDVASSPRGDDGLKMVEREKPDLLLLDVMLPGLDGFAIAKRIRATPALAATRIVMLTARTASEDIVRGPRAVEAQGTLADGVDADVAQGRAGHVCRRSPQRAVRPLAAKACEISRPDGESSMVFHDGFLRCAAFSQNSPSVFVRKIQPKRVKQESAEVKTTVLPASAASLPICCAIA